LSMIFLMPNLYIGLGLPITAPLATVVLAWALAVKLIRDSDDDAAAFRLVSVLLLIASVLYIVPQIYGLEAADQVDSLNSFVDGLGGLPTALSASADGVINDWAWPILNISLVLVTLTAAGLFGRFAMRLGRSAEEEPA
jgi:hypothetical protein